MTLAEQQAAIVAALTRNGPVPDGFDLDRVQAAADALAFKRARAVARAWPGLRAMLGAELRARFATYVSHARLPEQGGPLADGRAFVRWLAGQMPLADDVALQVLSVDQRWRQTARGLVPRRGPRVGFAWLPDMQCAIVAIGARELRLRLPRLRR